MHDLGYPPQFTTNLNLSEDKLFYTASMSLKDAYRWELIQLSGNYGEPFVRIGEMIIVSKPTDINTLDNKLVRMKIGSINKIGIINIIDDNCFSITAKETITYHKHEIKEVRAIQWTRKI